MSTQYKFYKTTCTAGNIDTTSATKNPLKLDEVENGGIVLAVNSKSDPSFGRMYFKNPFGTAYGKDGKLFEVGTNVSTLNVNGNATVGGGDIVLKDAIIRSTTESGTVRRVVIGTKPSGSGPIERLSRIEFNSQNVTMSGNVTVSDNLYVSQIAGVDNRSITVGNAVYFNEDVSFDQDVNIGESLVVSVGINTNDLAVGSGDSGLLTVNGELYSKINNVNQFYVDSNGTYAKGPLTVGTRVSVGDGVAPAVDWQGDDVSASGVHVWHNSDNVAYGVSIVGATDASGGGVYPQIRVYDGTANTCTIDMNGRYGDIKVSRNIRAEGTISGGVVKGTQLEIGSTFYRASFVNGVLSFSAV